MTGVFITFEGGPGAGKTTQARRLAQTLTEAGKRVTSTREPGHDTAFGSTMWRTLGAPRSKPLPPQAQALAYAASHADHVYHIINPALGRGDIVVCDQYTDASIAYQGFGLGCGPGPVGWLTDWATGHLTPDLVILLDIDPQTGLDRLATQTGYCNDELSLQLGLTSATLSGPYAGSSEQTLAIHRQARVGLLSRAQTVPDRYLQLDATDPADVLSAVIAGAVATLLGGLAQRPKPRGAKVIPITKGRS